MNRKIAGLARLYARVLGKYLNKETGRSLQPAVKLGRQAVALGMETLELARIHEQALVILRLANGENEVLKRAELFFNEAVAPICETHHAARLNRTALIRLNKMLSQRTAKLAVTQRLLQSGLVQRRGVERALKRSGEHYVKLLKESLTLQDSLRKLTRELLDAQEDERNEISHKLQDEIAQTLLGINVRLLSLKREARSKTQGLKNEIASTQRLVVQSAKSMRQTANDLTKNEPKAH